MLMWVAVCDNRYNQSGKQVRLEKSRVHQREISGEQSKLEPVSYTHLTLPTKVNV